MTKNQINTKTVARIAAMQVFYQFAATTDEADIDSVLLRIIDFYKDPDVKNAHDIADNVRLKIKPSYGYLKELVKFTHDNIEEIDKIIVSHLKEEWTIENLPPLLHALLRVAICEIKYFPETPRKVIINEYTDIAGDMLNENEIGFVNSVLDHYATKHG